MALIPKPAFPDVPQLPGVPQLKRSLQFPAGPPPVLGIGALAANLWQSTESRPVWGIFWLGNDKKLVQVLEPDSVLDFGYANEYKVADFPVQNGAFASYNKIASPFEIRLRMSKSGTLADRVAFLESLDRILQTLKLLVIITPERMYENCTIVRTEIMRRGTKGAYFLTDVDIAVRQVRQVTPQYSTTASNTANAKDPNAVPTANEGMVQPTNLLPTLSFDPTTGVGQPFRQ